MTHFDPKVTPWQVAEERFPRDWSIELQIRFLVNYAILAPSSHNTQPWQFVLSASHLFVYADESRWLQVADPDQRELYMSVGCALENLLVSAEHFGLGHETFYFPDPAKETHVATVNFLPEKMRSLFRPGQLFSAITVRHTNHQPYDEQTLPGPLLERFQACRAENDVQLHLSTDPDLKEKVDELVVQGDAIQFANPAFRDELGYWIGQGVFGSSWLMSKLGKLAVKHINWGSSQAKKDSSALMSSPVLGVIASPQSDREPQVQAGQLYQRLSLMAASFHVWCQPMSQVVEVPELRQKLAQILPDPQAIPLHCFRMGKAAAEKEHTPRRPLEEVMG